MTLQRKTFYVLALTTLSLLVALSFISRSILLKGFEKLEHEEAGQNVQRILSTLSDKLETLKNSTKDWAQWDDTYQYIQDKNEDFYKTNLEASTSFLNLRVNFMAYVRNSGEVVFYKAVDLNTEKEIPVWGSLKKYFVSDSVLLRHADVKSELKGFLSVPEGLALVASLPITTSSREGPIQGALIFGRYFDAQEIQHLSKTTLFSLTARRLSDTFLSYDFQEALPFLKQSPVFVQVIGSDLIAGYAMIKDISGQPVVVLRAEMPRKIFQQGQATLAFFNLALLIVALTFVVIVILLIREFVLSKLSRLMKDVGTIARSGESSKRVGLYGQDELAQLGASINTMLDSLEKSKAQLTQSEQRFQLVTQATNDIIWDWNLLTGAIWWNENYRKVFGYGEEESRKGLESWTQHLHPDDRDSVISKIHADIERGERFWSAEYRFARADGSYAFIFDRGYVMHDEKGKAVRMLGAMQDTTDRKRLQEQMMRAHRIDVVGKLAGGLAHDFNNLITAILGYGTLIFKNTTPGDKFHADVQEILNAGNRAKKLTNQLLAFSRQQNVQVETIQLNDFLSRKAEAIRELAGRKVEVSILPGNDLGLIRMDSDQLWEALGQVLKNAIEAMPEGGRIIVEAANIDLDNSYGERYQDIQTGSYVMVAVTDTGKGMTADVKSQLFEPFFTTKPHDQHEGLGLATAFGMVKQAQGHLFIYSETDRGTTVKICLPRYEEKQKAPSTNGKPAALSISGHETILLSENEPMVRRLSGQILREHGYRVLEAISGVDALQYIQKFPQQKIDLLLTDVVMPQIGGRELSHKVKSLMPGVKLLFISGYTNEAVVRQGIIDWGVPFLQKPFTPQVLACKVREVLDS